ncbi:GTP-binding protein YchF [Candida albicans P57072]|uniref:Obg-like ATPase 1 n=1 Tax=Candida albicans P78048 TaxID=1094989 RepID=A0AB34Q0G4_CANAX|nr:GTP-binding protein YchF [Candida albicans P94015]KGQ98880.1 GTP-binding protein YchF [Candida albicans P37005]KGR15617.1 GTP-binding protein YchF [Candida albicans P57072]KGR21517.1 GTP-binding protein YchF [Candida albicans P78048]KGU33863.1 GTP-binding protein YchF [Candida albicans P34048]KGU37696.1 GTP-binding protein YchF [Candida albicans P57055]KHC40526.1 GTP-binding protein YchF [Candida albicans P76055]KHC57449.1 GTP-binding protein YchF [Candida albicans P60002]KHC68659.1 GTP-
MAPKKKGVVEKPVLLGRPGNNLKSGIVGLANVGKSTFFQAITRCPLGNPANYPFATIDPEEARVIVPSPRFDKLCELYKPKSEVPAFLTVYDIAGLTKGAHAGEGLGNNFLANIRAVDSIFQMVRCFDDADIIHINDEVNPIADLDIIKDELRLKDIEFANTYLEGVEKIAKRGGQSLEVKQKKEEAEFVKKVIQMLEDGKRIANQTWTAKEVDIINQMFLLTAKPCIYLINLSEKDYIRKKNKYLLKIKEWVDTNSPGDLIVPLSVSLEEKLANMESDEEREAYCKEIGAQSALPKIIVAMRQKLDLISFFTGGPDEVREWTIRKWYTAPQAAGTIHTDLERTFILAQVIKYDDLIELGDENSVRAAGKLMQKGKDYFVEDGDIIYVKAADGKAR